MGFGLPKVLTSYQGSEFNNSLDTMLMEMLGIDHRLTTPYHPQVRTERDAMRVHVVTYGWLMIITAYHRLMGW